MRINPPTCCAIAVALALIASPTLPAAAQKPHTDARFVRTYWYQPGAEHGNPKHNSRFRVNAPQASTGPYSNRSETRGNGMMQVLISEDLTAIAAAELYLELWGGHPGTANKRVTINGRSTYPLPSAGTAADNCTHAYPVIPLRPTDLVNGYNALQFACDQGETFWGHYIVDNAAIRITLPDDDPFLESSGLCEEAPVVRAATDAANETIRLTLTQAGGTGLAIESVTYLARYRGYDENGDGLTDDWHGMTKERLPYATLGTATTAPFAIDWDVAMLPAQDAVAVRAIVRYAGVDDVTYETETLDGLRITHPPNAAVRAYGVTTMDRPYWSRAEQPKHAVIRLDTDPDTIDRAQLHIVIWDGGRGSTPEPFTINGHAVNVAGPGSHDVLYRVVDIDPAGLRRGDNDLRLLSDTEHHGIEVLLPGPALFLRTASRASP